MHETGVDGTFVLNTIARNGDGWDNCVNHNCAGDVWAQKMAEPDYGGEGSAGNDDAVKRKSYVIVAFIDIPANS